MSDNNDIDFDDSPMAHHLESFQYKVREESKQRLKKERKEKLELIMLVVSTVVGVLSLIVTIISIYL